MRCAVWAALAVAACSSTVDEAHSHATPADGGSTDSLVAPDATDETFETSTGKDTSVVIVQYPTQNNDVCPVSSADTPLLVCFASDPEPYQTYLGASATVGTCPKATDFGALCGACGPLQQSAAASLDAGASTDCCIFLKAGCGP